MADVSRSSPNIVYPEWQHEYQAALLELDTEELRERVAAAETAIFNRLQAISHDPDHTARKGKPSKMPWQASAFSAGQSWVS